VDAAVAERLLLAQRAAGPPLLPGASSGLLAGLRAPPPGHNGPRPRPASLRAGPGVGGPPLGVPARLGSVQAVTQENVSLVWRRRRRRRRRKSRRRLNNQNLH